MIWQDVQITPPPHNKSILIHFVNEYSKSRVVKAAYFAENTLEACDSDNGEYNLELGAYFVPEGWYEDVYAETGLDYNYHALGEIVVTHWCEIVRPEGFSGE